MSSKLLAAALALAAIASGPVLAENAGSYHHADRHRHRHAYAHRNELYSYDPNQPLLRGPRGFFIGRQTLDPAAPPFATDPDPHVRFELNRDANRGRN